MKKLTSIFLLLTIIISLASCANNNQHSDESSNPIIESNHADDYLDSFESISNNDNSAESRGDSANDSENEGDNTENDTTVESESSSENTKPNEKVNFVALLITLLNEYKWHPKSVIPEAMRPENPENLIDISKAELDYSRNTSVNNIPKNGIGEQWNMAIENIYESQIFFNILSVVDNVSAVSISAFNNYIDKNPAETAHYTFEHGIYSVAIHCSRESVNFVLDFTETVPGLGQQSIQIAMSMDILTEEKNVRVQVGDANALRYTVRDNNYTFAIKYLGVRRAYFEITENSDDTITGHIYEYLSIGSNELTASVSDFYITEDYVTVIGNKASGLVGFDGYICELYSTSNGRMIGYEVKESLAVSGVSVIYNTLWFDLEDISGITHIKFAPDSTDDDKEKFFVNGSSTAWEAKNYGITGGLKIASRRFDIEFRTQYFYYYDAVNETYEKIKLDVPMLFVQEEVLNSLSNDVRNTNNVSVNVSVNTVNLSKLRSEYATKTDLLVQNKNKYSIDNIINYIGTKKTF